MREWTEETFLLEKLRQFCRYFVWKQVADGTVSGCKFGNAEDKNVYEFCIDLKIIKIISKDIVLSRSSRKKGKILEKIFLSSVRY